MLMKANAKGRRMWRRQRPTAVVVAMAMAIGVGCGDSDDGDGEVAAGSQAKPPTTAVSSAERESEDEIRATYRRLTNHLSAVDARAACGEMTPSARKQYGGRGTCAEGLGKFLAGSKPSRLRPYIVALKIRGDRAEAQVKTKTSNRYPVRFRKQGTGWKVDRVLTQAQ